MWPNITLVQYLDVNSLFVANDNVRSKICEGHWNTDYHHNLSIRPLLRTHLQNFCQSLFATFCDDYSFNKIDYALGQTRKAKSHHE